MESRKQMTMLQKYQADVESILAKQHDNSGELWTSVDGRLGVGSPFSTLDCTLMLSEIGMNLFDPILKRTAELILSSW